MPVAAETLAARYADEGVVQSIPILTPDEVRHYRAALDRTCAAIGGRASRLDALHLFFDWAWQLATHPRLVETLELLLDAPVRLTSSRIFYKHPHSPAFVGWHQDGITERLDDARVPAVWLGLTEATIENGCLRVVPRSHRLGLLPHALRPDPRNLSAGGTSADTPLEPPLDVVMRAGEMSVHHPLVLHASNPNRSDGARIGFSATYSATSFGGDAPPRPPERSFDEAVAAYRAAGDFVLFERESEL